MSSNLEQLSIFLLNQTVVQKINCMSFIDKKQSKLCKKKEKIININISKKLLRSKQQLETRKPMQSIHKGLF